MHDSSPSQEFCLFLVMFFQLRLPVSLFYLNSQMAEFSIQFETILTLLRRSLKKRVSTKSPRICMKHLIIMIQKACKDTIKAKSDEKMKETFLSIIAFEADTF